MPAYRHLVDEAAALASERGGTHEEMAEEFIDRLFVLFGCEILKVVPGRVSTEVSASLPSTDPLARILDLFEDVIISVGRKQRIVSV